MREGVTLADPARFDLRGSVQAGRDVFIDVNVVLEGEVTLGEGVSIGPGCVLRDCELAAGTRVHAHSVLEGVRSTGRLRHRPVRAPAPGHASWPTAPRIGNFVEMKNARPRAKAARPTT